MNRRDVKKMILPHIPKNLFSSNLSVGDTSNSLSALTQTFPVGLSNMCKSLNQRRRLTRACPGNHNKARRLIEIFPELYIRFGIWLINTTRRHAVLGLSALSEVGV